MGGTPVEVGAQVLVDPFGGTVGLLNTRGAMKSVIPLISDRD